MLFRTTSATPLPANESASFREEEALHAPRLLSSYLSGLPAGVGTFLPPLQRLPSGRRHGKEQGLPGFIGPVPPPLWISENAAARMNC